MQFNLSSNWIFVLTYFVTSSHCLYDTSNIIDSAVELNASEIEWHDQLIEVLFGTYILEEFDYSDFETGFRCHAFNTKIGSLSKDCTNVYFRLLFSCLFLDPQNQTEKQCDCDSSCVYGNSCCFDAFFLLEPAKPGKYLERFLDLTRNFSHKICLPFMKVEKAYRITEVFMTIDCPNQSDPEKEVWKRQCLQTETFHPPVFVPGDMSIYMNEFCAKCNGHNSHYKINATAIGCTRLCTSKISEGHLTVTDVTGCRFIPQIGQSDLIHKATCNRDTKRIKEASLNTNFCNKQEYALCKSYKAEIKYDWGYYANPQCVKCIKGSVKFSYWYEKAYPPPYSNSESYSYDISYVNNKKQDGELRLEVGDPSCYSPTTLPEMTEFITAPTFELNKMFIRCIFEKHGSVYFKARQQKQQQHQRHQQRYLKSEQKIEAILEDTLENVLGFKTNLEKLPFTNFYDVRISGRVSGATGFMLAEAATDEYIWNDIAEILLTPLEFFEPSLIYGHELKHYFLGGKMCANPVTFDSEYADLIRMTNNCEVKGVYDDELIPNANGTKKNTIFWVEMTKNKLLYRTSVCQTFHLVPKCPILIYGEGMYKVGFDKTVTVVNSNNTHEVLAPEKYIPNSKGLAVCEKEATSSASHQLDGIWKSLLQKASVTWTIVKLLKNVAG